MCEFRVEIVAPIFVNKYLLKASQSTLHVYGKYVRKIPKSGVMFGAMNGFLSSSKIRQMRPDIIHETYYQDRGYSTDCAKSIITVHDMIHERLPSEFSRFDTTTKRKLSSAKRVDRVICVSENTKRDLLNFYDIPEEKVVVVYHGVADPVRSDRSSSIDKPYLLFVGHRAGYKNFERFIQAVARSKRLKHDMMIICFGGGELSGRELDMIRSEGLAESCVRTIRGDDDVLANLYEHAAALVYPSLYEGFGMPPLEAMSYGCPVVCSNTSSLPEVVGDAAELFDPHSVEDIIGKLESVVYSNARARDLINAGYLRVKEFTWDKCARETATVYLNAVWSQL